MNETTIIQPGTTVVLNQCIIAKAIICEIRTNMHLSYKCAWWNDGKHNTGWFDSCEVAILQQQPTEVKDIENPPGTTVDEVIDEITNETIDNKCNEGDE